jgi:subtilisin family serine protease
MKDATRSIVGILAVIFLSVPAMASDYKEGEVIVKFKAPQGAARSMIMGEESRAVTIAVDDTETAISEMQNRADVEYVEPNYIIKAESIPSDWPYSATQWGDVALPEAWDFMESAGSVQAVIIAVVDSGVDMDHPDLRDILVGGYDFANDDSVPEDDAGHGTRVCGIIGALGNNGGVAGVAWNTDIEIMPVKFMKKDQSGDTTGSLSDAVNSIYYAVDNGADIINASWGFSSYSRSLEEAIRYARDHGVLFVTSAGNSGQDNDANAHYPSNYSLDNIIAVAAMNSSGDLSTFSNYGLNSVDIAAPGEGMKSTDMGGGYVSWISGTSYASPFVAAVAAMVKSQSPEMSCQSLRNIVISSATKEDGYRFDSIASNGCVNAKQALLAEESLDSSSKETGSTSQTQNTASSPAPSGEGGGGGGGGCLIDSCQNPGSALTLLVIMILAVLFRMPRVRRLG